MSLRPILAGLLALLATALPAAATCDGPSLRDRLSPAELRALDAAVAATPYGQGRFWTASKEGRRITLAGTIHIHDPRLGALGRRLDDALAGAELLLLEMTPAEEARMQKALATDPGRLFVTAGPTLPERLDEATWDAVADAARARGIPPFLAAKFQPWYLAITLAMPACAMSDVEAGRRGLDHMLMERATAAGVPMRALEPWDMLFTLMEDSAGSGDLADAAQLDLLRTTLLAPALQEETLVALTDAYFAGRTGEALELSRLSAGFVPGLDPAATEALNAMTQDLLLAARNRAWLPVIEAAAQEHGTIVVAAGAAHLPGAEGLLALLAERGWTVAPLAE